MNSHCRTAAIGAAKLRLEIAAAQIEFDPEAGMRVAQPFRERHRGSFGRLPRHDAINVRLYDVAWQP